MNIYTLKQLFKTHPIRSIVLVFFIVFLLTVIITGIRDTIAQRQVARSMDVLVQQLAAAGLEDFKRSNGCWRLDTKMGPGTKRCEEFLNLKLTVADTSSSYMTDEEKEKKADDKLAAFAQVLKTTKDFKIDDPRKELPTQVRSPTSVFSASNRGYKEAKSGINCIASYTYLAKENALELRFTCDTTSWFTENIDRGWFGIEFGS